MYNINYYTVIYLIIQIAVIPLSEIDYVVTIHTILME
jgi:hypothetical protein